MKKIGVLLPYSKAYPKMGKDFMNGLNLIFSRREDIQLNVEGIGIGNDPKGIINSCQKLINQESVDIITGLLGHWGISEICDFVEGMDETMIYSDLGATIPLSLKNRKGIYCNSLELSKSIAELGGYFVKNGIKDIATSTCYYEAGYDFIEAMERGIHLSTDTEFAGHFITPLHPRENEADLMAKFVEDTNPDVIFGFHNSIYAQEHASYLKKNSVHKSIPMYTTPFSVEENIWTEHGDLLDGIQCVSSWFPELETPQNSTFIELYKKEFGKPPSIFALLGYENGLLIDRFFVNSNSKTTKLTDLKGPRGKLTINHETNRTEFPNYLWMLKSNGESYRRERREMLESNEITKNMFVDKSYNKSDGWQNAYLCH